MKINKSFENDKVKMTLIDCEVTEEIKGGYVETTDFAYHGKDKSAQNDALDYFNSLVKAYGGAC